MDDWYLPTQIRLNFSITRPCGCTKIVNYDESIGDYIVKYTRPIGSGECPGMGCHNHRGKTTFV